MAGFVSITHPTQDQDLVSPVSIDGTCSPPNRTITVTIKADSTVKATPTVTANGTNWATSPIPLPSPQAYTATASDGSASDTKAFRTG
jgi:hypothetical protein